MKEFNLSLNELLLLGDTPFIQKLDKGEDMNQKVYNTFNKYLFNNSDIIPINNGKEIVGFIYPKDFFYYLYNFDYIIFCRNFIYQSLNRKGTRIIFAYVYYVF